MSAALYDLPTTGAQTLRALGRYPDRVAFSWPSGSLTYRGAIELIGRMQNAFVRLNLPRGSCVAFLTSNRADTWCAGVAAQLSRLAITWLHPLGSLDDQLFQLELLLYGASPMAPSRLLEAIERIGPVLSQLYGQTECYPVSVLRKADHDPSRPELFLSCGFPIAGCEAKILDDQDREVPTGQAGEICVRAPHVMAEYWRRPEQTAETLKNGWLHTGDIARADERGYVFILDRKKDMIVTQRFPARGGGCAGDPCRCRCGRSDRHSRRQVGRSRHRSDRAKARHRRVSVS
jgi:long-subunit acyl-CoA synthetase (AMP-forming)